MSDEQRQIVQNLYRLAYVRAQAQLIEKEWHFRELIADVNFEQNSTEQNRFRQLVADINFGAEW